MTIQILLKIGAVGILVALLNQILKHSGKEEHAYLLKVGEVHLHIFLVQLTSKAFIQGASGSRNLALCGLTIKIADSSRGHDRNQQHGRFEHMHVIIVCDVFTLRHKMLICAFGLC